MSDQPHGIWRALKRFLVQLWVVLLWYPKKAAKRLWGRYKP